ncbi:hypothetical protein [Desulforhopalus sp. IMCC35007]|uniref:hypothetical protein n=1 Tax=Desulforhopalus sp. IMCC35007 TaxID=2569543 RepID=UPI0010ADD9F5|nr:hypothetical protein [Desulforhopalus sp. IMCC35007]TKB07248.1 hypothetical protein FCL48_17380 [Desulforhopalus sp. IMCC35007]
MMQRFDQAKFPATTINMIPVSAAMGTRATKEENDFLIMLKGRSALQKLFLPSAVLQQLLSDHFFAFITKTLSGITPKTVVLTLLVVTGLIATPAAISTC